MTPGAEDWNEPEPIDVGAPAVPAAEWSQPTMTNWDFINGGGLSFVAPCPKCGQDSEWTAWPTYDEPGFCLPCLRADLWNRPGMQRLRAVHEKIIRGEPS